MYQHYFHKDADGWIAMHVMLPHVSTTHNLHAVWLPDICICPCPARGSPQPRDVLTRWLKGWHSSPKFPIGVHIRRLRIHRLTAQHIPPPHCWSLSQACSLTKSYADKINNKCLPQIGQLWCLTATSTPHELLQLLKAGQQGLRRTCGLLAPCRVFKAVLKAQTPETGPAPRLSLICSDHGPCQQAFPNGSKDRVVPVAKKSCREAKKQNYLQI